MAGVTETSDAAQPPPDADRIRALRGAYRSLVTETTDEARRAAREEEAELEERRAATRVGGSGYREPRR